MRNNNLATIMATKIQNDYQFTYPIDLRAFCRSIGIKLIEDQKLDVDGYLYKDLSKKYIFVNKRLSETQKNFVIAHELGHYFLHTNQTLQICSGIVKAFDSREIIQETEYEANTFASELLMPSEKIKEDLPKRTLSFSDIEKISLKYNVSLTAASIKSVRCSITENEMLICYKNKSVLWVVFNEEAPFFVEKGTVVPRNSIIENAFDNAIVFGEGISQKGVWHNDKRAREEFITTYENTKLLLLSEV